MFSDGSSSEISFATVTPSCVTVGAPNFLSRDTLRPLGPRVTFTASASVSIPFFKERRASSVIMICLAIISTPRILFFTVQSIRHACYFVKYLCYLINYLYETKYIFYREDRRERFRSHRPRPDARGTAAN